MKKILFLLIVFGLLVAGCTQQVENPQTGPKGSVMVSLLVEADGEKLVDKVFSVEAGKTAFEVLKDATEVDYKEYNFGVLVTSIAGVEAGQSNYWAVYVDGAYSERGLSQIVLEKDTELLLRLEKIQR